MNGPFAHAPVRMDAGIPCFGHERDGDCFDASDVAEWRGGRLLSNWRKSSLLEHSVMRWLLEQIIQDETYVIDLASGPGLGLIPGLNQLRPGFPCMATDANLDVLREWQSVLNGLCAENIGLAQCSLMALPFRDDSVGAYSSMIGLSSTRGGEDGCTKALTEIHRTLVPDGKLYTVEAEWTDIPAILALFEQMHQPPWEVFLQPQHSWRERFLAAGFTILHEQEAERLYLRPEDNDLGAAAAAHGVKVGMRRMAYILQK